VRGAISDGRPYRDHIKKVPARQLAGRRSNRPRTLRANGRTRSGNSFRQLVVQTPLPVPTEGGVPASAPEEVTSRTRHSAARHGFPAKPFRPAMFRGEPCWEAIPWGRKRPQWRFSRKGGFVPTPSNCRALSCDAGQACGVSRLKAYFVERYRKVRWQPTPGLPILATCCARQTERPQAGRSARL
jgi:hypothetical protein